MTGDGGGQGGDWYEWLTCFDWLSPLLHLANNAAGQVTLQGTAFDIRELERAGVRCGAPVLDVFDGTYIFTVRKSDVPRARRVLTRSRALGG